MTRLNRMSSIQIADCIASYNESISCLRKSAERTPSKARVIACLIDLLDEASKVDFVKEASASRYGGWIAPWKSYKARCRSAIDLLFKAGVIDETDRDIADTAAAEGACYINLRVKCVTDSEIKRHREQADHNTRAAFAGLV